MASTQTDIIKLTNVTLSFPELTTPKAFEEGKERVYQATALIDPSSKEGAALIKRVQKEIKDLLARHYGSEDKIPKNFKVPLKNNEKEGKEYAGYEGKWFLQARRKERDGRPGLAGRDPRIPLNPEDIDRMFYPGAVVNMTFHMWVYDGVAAGRAQHGRSVVPELRAIQFVKDGERLGGVAPVEAENEFDIVDVDDDIDGLDDDFDLD